MKKVLACLLSMAIMLSFIPAQALADTGPGMYANWDEIRGVSNLISGQPMGVINQPEVNGYVVEGESAYYIADTGVTIQSESLNVELINQEVYSYNVYKLSPGENYSGVGDVNLSSGGGFPVVFEGYTTSEPEPPQEMGAMYAYDNGEYVRLEFRNLTTEADLDTEHPVYGYIVPPSYDAEAYYVCPISWTVSEKIRPDGSAAVNVTRVGTSGGNVVYRLTPGAAYGEYGDFHVKDENGSGMDMGVVFARGTLEAEHAAADGEVVQAHGNDYYQPVSFRYEGDTYYLGITDARQVTQPYDMGGIYAAPGQVDYWNVCVGFWHRDASGYALVDAQTRDELLAAFGDSLRLSICAIDNEAAVIPARQNFVSTSGWLPAATWVFDDDCDGKWEISASGTISGRTLTVYTLFGREVRDVIVQTFSAADGVEAINSWLATVEEGQDVAITLGAGEFNGVIELSAGVNATIRGTAGSDGQNLTQLHGGICFGAGSHSYFEKLDFVGAGKDNRYRPDGEYNYAVYSDTQGLATAANYQRCNFRGYYIAINAVGRFGCIGDGLGSVFEQNHIAFRLDASTGDGGANNHMTGNVFRENDIAMSFEGFAADFPPRHYVFRDISFIDNETDVYNRSGRNIFLPGNYFVHDGERRLEADTGGDLDVWSWNANFVSVYPIASDRTFEQFDYDVGLETVVLSNSRGAEFLIPAKILAGMIFDLILDEGDADIYGARISFPNRTASSNGGTVVLAEEGEEGFDPTVKIDRTDTQIKITLNKIPGSLAPTVTVPCEGWENARVSFDGATLESEFAGEAVSFTAAQGGTYTITRAEAELERPPVISVPSKPDDTEDEPETETPATPVFDDVSEDDYFAAAVDWAVENEITAGVSESSFAPEQDCTRAQVVTFLWRAMGSPEPAGTGSFDDVASGEYYGKAVQWALANGITGGVSDSLFGPGETVIRAQVVTFLWRAAGSPQVEGEAFGDVPEDAYYAAAVRWAVSLGITTGTGNATFSPEETCTRAQVVTFLYRFLSQ